MSWTKIPNGPPAKTRSHEAHPAGGSGSSTVPSSPSAPSAKIGFLVMCHVTSLAHALARSTVRSVLLGPSRRCAAELTVRQPLAKLVAMSEMKARSARVIDSIVSVVRESAANRPAQRAKRWPEMSRIRDTSSARRCLCLPLECSGAQRSHAGTVRLRGGAAQTRAPVQSCARPSVLLHPYAHFLPSELRGFSDPLSTGPDGTALPRRRPRWAPRAAERQPDRKVPW